MIAHLEGKLRHKAPEGLIVDVNGVGYAVLVPLSTFYHLPDPGQPVSLHVHTHVREDAIQLFGFRTAQEKEMFLHLVTISGVGPRLAVNILSGISPDELRQVIFYQDKKRLQNLPGVGKKIAERLLLEMKDRLKIKTGEKEPPADLAAHSSAYGDAFSALMNLGYKAQEAEKALQKTRGQLGEEAPLETLLRESLRILA